MFWKCSLLIVVVYDGWITHNSYLLCVGTILLVSFIDRLIDWLIDWLVDELIDCSADWLIDWLVKLFGCSIDWLKWSYNLSVSNSLNQILKVIFSNKCLIVFYLVLFQAAEIFQEGIKEERDGRHFEAVRLYRRAIQLDPDIEHKFEKSTDAKKGSKSRTAKDATNRDIEDEGVEEISAEELLENLLGFNIAENGTCQPALPANGTHISALPCEIVQYLTQWIVSAELDMLSLEQFARVCKGNIRSFVRSIDWLFDRLIDWLIGRSIDCLLAIIQLKFFLRFLSSGPGRHDLAIGLLPYLGHMSSGRQSLCVLSGNAVDASTRQWAISFFSKLFSSFSILFLFISK